MNSKTSTRLSTCHVVDSRLVKHTKFTTAQKAKINKCLELVNEYLFEIYDEPKKVYNLNDIYKVLGKIMNDGLASNIDEAIKVFQQRLQ